MTAAIALELRRLAAAVEAQGDELTELRRCLLEKADRRTGARLVPALGRLTEGQPFEPAEVAALALNAAGPAAGVVCATVADLADLDGGLRGFGRLLTRLRGARFGPWRLEPASGGRWRVGRFLAE